MPLFNPIPSMTASVAGIATSATQAQQETGTATTVSVAPGVQQYHPSASKGWAKVLFNGTASVSYNVASVTDNGAGDETVNWTTSFSTTNQVTVATTQADPGGAAGSTYTTQVYNTTTGASASRVWTGTLLGPGTDTSAINVIAFGDQ